MQTKQALYLTGLAVLHLLFTVSTADEMLESDYLFKFIRAVDPQNCVKISLNGLFLPRPCNLKGVKCNLQRTSITEIRLESLNLSGRIDADSLCKLHGLKVLSLANNLIHGSIPNSLSDCRKLTYLNLSRNLLSGTVPVELSKLKHLRRLDISKNCFSCILPSFNKEFKHVKKHSMNPKGLQMSSIRNLMEQTDSVSPPAEAPKSSSPSGKSKWSTNWIIFLLLVLGIGLFMLFICSLSKKTAKLAKEREILKALQASPLRVSPIKDIEEMKLEGKKSDLVFFVEEIERFTFDDLIEGTADLQGESICSSLYKVTLKNKNVYAVKRLKNLQVSFEEFSSTTGKIGNLKHPNILPLVGYNSTDEEKLLIYKYQSNGSLFNLLESIPSLLTFGLIHALSPRFFS